MPNLPPCLPLRDFARRLCFAFVMVAALITLLATTPILFSQKAPDHLNPVVAKLAAGKPFISVSTRGDLSWANAHALARADVDDVYVDMEHSPMDMEALRNFEMAMIDKEAILKKGNAQPNVALFARFAPYGREPDSQQWVIKQALDIGVMGIIFNGVDSKEQALLDVETMRYPQHEGSAHPQPPGFRGIGLTNAVWAWGIPDAEYVRHADLWPLNPQGDLMAIMMIETAEGLKNVDEIASVPGVGGIYVGGGNDLHDYLGVPAHSPVWEAAMQKILKACLAHNVACGIEVGKDAPQRIKEGWKMLAIGAANGGLTAENDANLRSVHAALGITARSPGQAPE